jgi:hypothetical protein
LVHSTMHPPGGLKLMGGFQPQRPTENVYMAPTLVERQKDT